MNRGLRCYLFSGFVAAVLVGSTAAVAFAVDLSNTAVPTATFFGVFCNVVPPGPMVSPFDFAPATPGGDGVVGSTVFTGSLPSAPCASPDGIGLFAYVYKLTHFAASSEPGGLSGISMDWGPLTTSVFGTSFFITEPTAGKAPSSAEMNPVLSTGALTFHFISGSRLSPDEFSHAFGAVSIAPPIVVVANVLNTGAEVSASVFAPAPAPVAVSEPSSILLFSSGLLSLAWAVRRRRAFVLT